MSQNNIQTTNLKEFCQVIEVFLFSIMSLFPLRGLNLKQSI